MVVFLILGAIASLGAAWACERWFDVRMLDTNLVAALRREAFDKNDAAWILDAFESPGTRVVRLSAEDSERQQRSCGWPMLCLDGTISYHADALHRTWRKEVHGAVMLEGSAFLSRDVPGTGGGMGMQAIPQLLPYRPIWSGFAINAGVWGGVLWIVWMLPWSIRSRLWRLRGRCAGCGYPVGVSHVCTECGRPFHMSQTPRNGNCERIHRKL